MMQYDKRMMGTSRAPEPLRGLYQNVAGFRINPRHCIETFPWGYVWDLYYNPKTGYKSAVKMYKTAKEKGINVSLKQVENFIWNQPTAQLNKQKNRKVSYNHIVANHVNDVWQADLLDVQKWKRFNHGYRWILNVIDVYSRFAFAVPLKTKSTKEVAEAFRIIFKQIAPYEIKPEYRVKPIITPENLTTDNGKEL